MKILLLLRIILSSWTFSSELNSTTFEWNHQSTISADKPASRYTDQELDDEKTAQQPVNIFFNKINSINLDHESAPSDLHWRGQTTSDFKILYNDIPINDPSSPTGSADLSLINFDRPLLSLKNDSLQSESTEITGFHYKFLQGTLPHSNANISFGKTLSSQTHFQFTSDYSYYRGVSIADEKMNPNADRDVSRKFSNEAEFTFFENQIKYSFFLKHLWRRDDLDKFLGPGGDDVNDYQVENTFLSRLLISGQNFYFNTYHTIHQRKAFEIYDTIHPESTYNYYSGKLTGSVFETNHFILKWERESDSSDHKFNYLGLSLKNQLFNELIQTNVTINHKNPFPNYVTADFYFKYKSLSSTLKSEIKYPTLSQFYMPIYGNQNLRPQNKGYSDLSFQNEIMSLTIFYYKIWHQFSYDPVTFISNNSGTSETYGIENKYHFFNSLNLIINATKSYNLSNHTRTVRIPDISSSLEYTLQNLQLSLNYIGNRVDQNINLKPYLLTNLSYRYSINKSCQLNFSFLNLFNIYYTSIYGQGSPGREFNLSVVGQL